MLVYSPSILNRDYDLYHKSVSSYFLLQLERSIRSRLNPRSRMQGKLSPSPPRWPPKNKRKRKKGSSMLRGMHDLSYVHSFFQLCHSRLPTYIPICMKTPHPEKPGKKKKKQWRYQRTILKQKCTQMTGFICHCSRGIIPKPLLIGRG